MNRCKDLTEVVLTTLVDGSVADRARRQRARILGRGSPGLSVARGAARARTPGYAVLPRREPLSAGGRATRDRSCRGPDGERSRLARILRAGARLSRTRARPRPLAHGAGELV